MLTSVSTELAVFLREAWRKAALVAEMNLGCCSWLTPPEGSATENNTSFKDQSKAMFCSDYILSSAPVGVGVVAWWKPPSD